jgi:hypothetical protein
LSQKAETPKSPRLHFQGAAHDEVGGAAKKALRIDPQPFWRVFDAERIQLDGKFLKKVKPNASRQA